MEKIHHNWWRNFFDENYLAFWDSRGAFDDTQKEIKFLEKITHLQKKHLVLDLCCGHGRHSIELAKKGYKVIGLDYSKYELDLARKAAQAVNLKIDFRRGDARIFRFKERFELIINMFTAFGYGSRGDDRRIIRSAAFHLKKGGLFFIDYINFFWLLRNYKSRGTDKIGRKKVSIERKYDFLNDVNIETRTFAEGRRKKVYKLKLRFYTLAQMIDLFESEGLKILKYWGKLGEPYSMDSKRMLILAKKIY